MALGEEVATASTTWVIEPMPHPASSNTSIPLGVSCPSISACTAVGQYFDSSASAYLTLAERWNGTSWAIQSTPNPAGATASALSGVSCPSTGACTAVGSYINSSGVDVTLAERWNGTSWAIQSTANPAGATASALSGVSCPSTNACTAVGNYVLGSSNVLTMAERWNGTSWAIQTTPNPAGAELRGVSCPSTNACTAVGAYANSSGVAVTLAERWNGTSWAIQSTPNPTGALGSQLTGVSCPSTSACTAFGSYANSSGAAVTLAERWNGTRWAIQSTPNPTGATHSEVKGVSCPSTSVCTAVGSYANSSGVSVTLAERWNGTAWAIQSTHNPTGATHSELNGVSCPSTSACTAVGDVFIPIHRRAFAEHN